MENKITIINSNDEKEFYLALNYSFSLNKKSVLIIDCTELNYLSNLYTNVENDDFIFKKEFFKIKPKKLSKNLDYIKMNYKSLYDELFDFLNNKYENLVFVWDFNKININKKDDVLSIIFFKNDKRIEDNLIDDIKNKLKTVILTLSFDQSLNSKVKEDIFLSKTFQKYIFKNKIPFPTINFYEKPYIINESFFDKNIVSFFKELKNNM